MLCNVQEKYFKIMKVDCWDYVIIAVLQGYSPIIVLDDFFAISRKRVASLLSRVRGNLNSILMVTADKSDCSIPKFWLNLIIVQINKMLLLVLISSLLLLINIVKSIQCYLQFYGCNCLK